MAEVFTISPIAEIPLIIYIIIGFIVFTVMGLAVAFMRFLRRDFKNVISRFSKIEASINGLGNNIINAVAWVGRIRTLERKIYDLDKDVDRDMSDIKNYVVRENASNAREIKDHLSSKISHEIISVERKIGKLEREFDKQMDLMKKQMKKTTSDLVRFNLFRIISDLSDQTEMNSIDRKLDELKAFVEFNKKKGYWNKQLQKTVDTFLGDMEGKWKKKSKSIATLYTMFLKENKK